MAEFVSHIIGNEHLVLSADRTVFWENENTLIIADLHIGKTGHFRKAGIGVPPQVYKDDLHRLLAQLLFFKAEKLIIVGDLSHSGENREMELFTKWRRDFSSLEIELVKGNHDILEEKWYSSADITVCEDALLRSPFVFTHDVFASATATVDDGYIFSGHVHPGITIRGKGRQSLRFPCFYFAGEYCILPAFSRFTGTYGVQPKKGEMVYAVMDRQVCKL